MIPETIIDRVLAGEATAEEREQYRAWAHDNPGEAQRWEAVRQVAFGGVTHLPSYSAREVSRFAGKVLHAATVDEPRATVAHHTTRRISNQRGNQVRPQWLRPLTFMATGATAAVIAAVIWIQGQPSSEAAYDTYITQPGQQATVALRDGSEVILNAGSQLAVPHNFGSGSRDVRLVGEALFRVRHTTTTPFTVITGSANNVVLGTEFVVRAYDSAASRVVVTSGRVAVNGVTVGANQVAEAGRQTVLYTANAEQIAEALAFTRHECVIDRLALRDAIGELERWYGIQIVLRVPNEIANRPLVATLSRESPRELAALLEFAFPVSVLVDDRTLTITSVHSSSGERR